MFATYSIITAYYINIQINEQLYELSIYNCLIFIVMYLSYNI